MILQLLSQNDNEVKNKYLVQYRKRILVNQYSEEGRQASGMSTTTEYTVPLDVI